MLFSTTVCQVATAFLSLSHKNEITWLFTKQGIRKVYYVIVSTQTAIVMQEIWMKPSQDGKDSVKLPFSNYVDCLYVT